METKDLTLLEKATQFSRKSNFDPYKAKFKPFDMTYNDAMGEGQYHYNRNFIPLPFDLLDKEDFFNNYEAILPSDEYFLSQIEDKENKDEDTIAEELEELKVEWYDSCTEIYTNLHRITDIGEDYFLDGDYCNADVLAEFGFRVLEYKDYTFLNIPGYGYSTMYEHFVRLFTFLGWMKVEE